MGTEKESSQTQPKGCAKSSCEPLWQEPLFHAHQSAGPWLCAAEAVPVTQQRLAGSAGHLPTRWLGHPSTCGRFITESGQLEQAFEIFGSIL